MTDSYYRSADTFKLPSKFNILNWYIKLTVCACVRARSTRETTFLTECLSVCVCMCVFAPLCVAHIAAGIRRSPGRTQCAYP